MNICFIEDTPVYGGGQEWIVDTISEFNKLGHHISLVVPEKNKTMIEKVLTHSVKVYTYDWETIPTNKKSFKLSWIDALLHSDIAICSVHPPRDGFHCVGFAAECIKEAGNKAILVPKTGTIVPAYIREYYIPDPDVKTEIITITAFTKHYLVDTYGIPKSKVHVLYQGTNINKFKSDKHTKEEAHRRYPLPHKKFGPIIGMIGSFEERKGHVVLLKALKQLQRTTMPNILAVFVGKGPTEHKLKMFVDELGIHGSVVFFPFTHEPNYVYEQLDMFVLPSLFKEGLPNVILEAMSMGVPCIASRLAGTPELIHDNVNGYLVKPGDVELLAARITNLWSDKTILKKFGINSKHYVRTRFDRKIQAYKYSDFLDKVFKKYNK